MPVFTFWSKIFKSKPLHLFKKHCDWFQLRHENLSSVVFCGSEPGSQHRNIIPDEFLFRHRELFTNLGPPPVMLVVSKANPNDLLNSNSLHSKKRGVLVRHSTKYINICNLRQDFPPKKSKEWYLVIDLQGESNYDTWYPFGKFAPYHLWWSCVLLVIPSFGPDRRMEPPNLSQRVSNGVKEPWIQPI